MQDNRLKRVRIERCRALQVILVQVAHRLCELLLLRLGRGIILRSRSGWFIVLSCYSFLCNLVTDIAVYFPNVNDGSRLALAVHVGL